MESRRRACVCVNLLRPERLPCLVAANLDDLATGD